MVRGEGDASRNPRFEPTPHRNVVELLLGWRWIS